MVQSSDKSDSKRNIETDSTQAEQILDSIIEHIESTDKSETGDEQTVAERSRSDQMQSDENSAQILQQEQQSPAPNTNADFENIELRAAALASKLGGTGLSYNAGVKKYLDQSLDPDEPELELVTPLVKAAIHQDDLDVDSKRFGISDLADHDHRETQAQAEELSQAELIQQQTHVSKWDAELQDEQGVEANPSADSTLEEVTSSAPGTEMGLVDEPPAESEDVTEKHSEPQEVEKKTVGTMEQSLELEDIESNIEALSISMKHDHDLQIEQLAVETQAQSIVEPVPTSIPLDEMELRVTSLETHIVKLLDDVALSEQKLGDKVSEIVRSQSQKAVQEAIEASVVFGAMKAELATAAEQRHLQDVRMSDSLDALHDALKDIGDRVKSMETGGVVAPQAAEMNVQSSGGILSAVFGTSLTDSGIEDRSVTPENDREIEDPVADPIVPAVGEEIPAWLSDSTLDTHANQQGTQIESADVFASSSEPPEISSIESSIEEGPVMAMQEVAVQVHEEAELGASPMISDLDAPTATNLMQSDGDVLVGPGDQPSEQVQTDVVEEIAHEPMAGNDFLRSARAAARAANERTREIELANQAAGGRSKSVKKIGNFIAAAKQKDLGVESNPIVEKVTSGPKNSLFTDKVQGPNSLLVFTSLILFGTSALLLYGMSRGDVDTGSVVKLNALEKMAVQQPVLLRDESGTPRKKKLIEKTKAKKGTGGDRSNLKSSIGVATANRVTKFGGADTLTDQDKMDSSRIAGLLQEPSAVQYTGAINGTKPKLETGSLFDQYISFTAPSGALEPSNKTTMKTGSAKLTPAKTVGSEALLKSASRGDALAQYEVARRFGKGIGVQKSAAISVEWYEKSAKAGYPPAIYRLATMYERGNGVAKDYKRAMELYISAAEKGNVKAMHNLAVLYTGGNLGKADYSNAISWYSKAAQYGVKDSQFNLAIIYQNGMGGKLDLEQAYKWYSLAARAGDKEAKDMVADLRRELSSAKREKLDKFLRIWKPMTPDKNANVVSQYRKASLHVPAGKKT